METPDRRTWRRHLHFSVRALIVLVLMVGGWLGWMMRAARVQRQALATIRRAGGNYSYDWEYVDGEFVPFTRPRWPAWLVARLGEDYFGHVRWVGLYDIRPPEDEPMADYEKRRFAAALAQIPHLDQLEELDAENIEVGDAALTNLQRLTHLKRLTLSGTNLTNPGFLETMTELEELDLNDSPVGDAGLAHLRGLTRLRTLELGGTDITDAGLAHLRGLIRLQDLYLGDLRDENRGHMKITEVGVHELQKALPALKILR